MLSSSSLPLSVPGTTVDRQCGSSQQALHFAVQAVMSGTQDIVIAGGAESMSSVPMMSNLPKGLGKPNSDVCQNKFGPGGFYSQFVGAELIGTTFGISREEQDAWAAQSHARAAAAQASGRFDDELVVVEGIDKEDNAVPRRGQRMARLAGGATAGRHQLTAGRHAHSAAHGANRQRVSPVFRMK